MFSSKLKAMSIGAVWVLRDRRASQSLARNGIIVVVAEPIRDESSQTLLKNCLQALGWSGQTTYFELPAESSSEIQRSALGQLQQQVLEQLPQCVIVFGPDAGQLIDSAYVTGHAHYYKDAPIVVTRYLNEMISNPNLKAQVWADLCLVKDSVNGLG